MEELYERMKTSLIYFGLNWNQKDEVVVWAKDDHLFFTSKDGKNFCGIVINDKKEESESLK
jgi:hypothetical protein